MSTNETTGRPSAQALRAGAMTMIAAGNPLASVAAVFGVPAETLRTLLAQPGQSLPGDVAPPAPAPPWHQFPGTAVFRSPGYDVIVVFGGMLIFLMIIGWMLFFAPTPVPRKFLGLWMLCAIGCTWTLIHMIRAAPVNRFEMGADAIARFTLAGRVVLPYADIVAYSSAMGKGYYDLKFLTRHGVALTLYPSFAQMEDEKLAAWLQLIPERDSALTQSPSTRLTNWLCGLLLAGGMLFAILRPAVIAVHDSYEASISAGWPTADGVVTESVFLSGGGKSCRYGLRLHYTYTVQQHAYTGDNYRFGGICTADARAIAAAYPVGKSIAVHYRPAHPADSVIAPGAISFNMAYDILACLGVAAFLGAVFLRGRKRQPS